MDGDMEALISKKEDTCKAADSRGDREPPTHGKQYRKHRQSSNGNGRRELPVAHEDQYLWEAQHAYPDNDHMNKATKRPAPKTTMNRPWQQKAGGDSVLECEGAKMGLRRKGCRQHPL
jgi:hypothetical protein